MFCIAMRHNSSTEETDTANDMWKVGPFQHAMDAMIWLKSNVWYTDKAEKHSSDVKIISIVEGLIKPEDAEKTLKRTWAIDDTK